MAWHHEGVSETKVFVHSDLKIAHCNTVMSNKYTAFQSGVLECLFQAHTKDLWIPHCTAQLVLVDKE